MAAAAQLARRVLKFRVRIAVALDRLNGTPKRYRVTKELHVKLDFAVHQYGTDTSGRPIYATAAFEQTFQAALADSRLDSFRSLIVTVQGAFMSRVPGGGADASAGYHDQAGCRDVRTWNLTLAQQAVLWEVMDDYGIRFWKRDLTAAHGGMDEHGHGLAIWDRPLASGAAYQATQARGERDGLASNNPDYMPRKHPVLEQPPAWIFKEEMTMDAEVKKAFARLEKKVDQLNADLDTFRSNELKRDIADRDRARKSKADLVAKLGGLADQLTAVANDVKDDATRAQVQQLRATVLHALADDPDVDGPDNPATPA